MATSSFGRLTERRCSVLERLGLVAAFGAAALVVCRVDLGFAVSAAFLEVGFEAAVRAAGFLTPSTYFPPVVDLTGD